MERQQKLRYFKNEIRIPEDVEKTRTITFISSTFSKDSHGTVLNQDNWDLSRCQPGPLDFSHNSFSSTICNKAHPDDTIGFFKPRIENNSLVTDCTFETKAINESADKVFEKVKFGSIRFSSVTFSPIGEGHFGEGEEAEGRSDQTFFFGGQELLGLAICPMGSNPDTFKKSIRNQTTEALFFIHRELGISFSEIEKMTVEDILKALENRGVKKILVPTVQIEKDVIHDSITTSATVKIEDNSVDNIEDLKLEHEHLNINKGWNY